jgi:acetyl-CoA carboxylase carboxyl transferase subunit alpha
MPQYPNRQFLDFEQPIKELYEQIDQTKKLAEKNSKIDYSQTIQQLENSVFERRKNITAHLTPWQRVQLSRHPDRPYTMKYIDKMLKNFIEIHGDRNVKDDKLW